LWKRNLQNSDWLSSVVQEKVERQGNRSGTGREKPEEQESVSSHSETPGGFEESQEKLVVKRRKWGARRRRRCYKRLSLSLHFFHSFLGGQYPLNPLAPIFLCQPIYDGQPTVDKNSLQYV